MSFASFRTGGFASTREERWATSACGDQSGRAGDGDDGRAGLAADGRAGLDATGRDAGPFPAAGANCPGTAAPGAVPAPPREILRRPLVAELRSP